MRAKSAVKLRARVTAHKCDLCGRKLMTVQALIAHQRTTHNIVTRKTKNKTVIKPAKKVEIKVKPVTKVTNPRQLSPKPKDKAVKNVEPEKKENEPIAKKKVVEFECPKCFSIFSTYFPAHKHIQKFHCVNRQGMKVPPNSPTLIQPVRIELCFKCNRKVKSIQTHVCEVSVKNKIIGQKFICMACEEYFLNLKSFDLHVLNLHGNEVESMFFPTYAEFTKWKTEMETQMNVSYAVLDKYDSKRYYHCNYVKKNPEKSDLTYFCPSTIVIQEFSKGIQVHFYRQHYKHTYTPYSLLNKYKKYSITAFLKRSEEYNNLPTSNAVDNDMYLQFKTLMEGIVVDAAKINIATLKILLGKALDMTSILTNYDEENDDSNVVKNISQSMSDNQITKVLEDANITIGNTNISKLADENDENKDVVSSPKILNSFSLAKDVSNVLINDEDLINNSIGDAELDTTNIVVPLKAMNEIDSPSSFNDSYKDFVVKNFKIPEPDVSKRNRPTRHVVKTKIGQFKPVSPKSLRPKVMEDPKKSDSPKSFKTKVTEDTKKSESPKVNKPKLTEETKKDMKKPKLIESKEKQQESIKKVKLIEKKLKHDDDKEQESAKKVIFQVKKVKNLEDKEENIKKVKFIYRKGKHNLENKYTDRDSAKKPKLKLKPKTDIAYEVKEQENDCNILILKL